VGTAGGSVRQQIEEIDYELVQRKNVYARIASSDPKRKSELDYHVTRLEAVRDTLIWLQDHERLIKQRLAT
jgi:predicted site-specific integrase-resolvase